MQRMNTHDLIDSLAREARPVRRMPSPMVSTFVFVVGVIPVLWFVAWALDMREDLRPHFRDMWWMAIMGSLLAASAVGTLALATLAQPGRKGYRAGMVVAGALVLAMVALVLSRTPWVIVPDFRVWASRGAQCVGCALLAAALPAGIGLGFLRRGAPTRPVLAGALLGAAMGVLGTLTVGWVCNWDEPAHILIAHLLLPVGGLTALGALVGWRWLRW